LEPESTNFTVGWGACGMHLCIVYSRIGDHQDIPVAQFAFAGKIAYCGLIKVIILPFHAIISSRIGAQIKVEMLFTGSDSNT
jgi:hypothetical protein